MSTPFVDHSGKSFGNWTVLHFHSRAKHGQAIWLCKCTCGNEKPADHLHVGPAKSSGRFTTAHKDAELGVRVNCGCFSGSVLEFSQAIEKTHATHPEALAQYRLFCQLIAFNFGVEA